MHSREEWLAAAGKLDHPPPFSNPEPHQAEISGVPFMVMSFVTPIPPDEEVPTRETSYCEFDRSNMRP